MKTYCLEPQLNARYSDYLAEYLRSGFTVRQIGNTYNTLSNGLEQMMTLGILIIGAWTVMNNTQESQQAFTIGMLVAFQMFASRLSQPMLRVLLGLQPRTTTAYPLRVLRLVGLWQQFQQANLSVQRMGDIMNADIVTLAEPYSILPTRLREGNHWVVNGSAKSCARLLACAVRKEGRAGQWQSANRVYELRINRILDFE